MPFFCLLLMTSTFSVGNLSRDIDEKSIREPRVRNKLFGKEGGGGEGRERGRGGRGEGELSARPLAHSESHYQEQICDGDLETKD